MANPNNCATCEYSQLNGNREKGHCYMFRDEPADVCMQHTGRKAPVSALVEWARNLKPSNVKVTGAPPSGANNGD